MSRRATAARTHEPEAASPLHLTNERPITLVEKVVDAVVRAAAVGHFLPGDRLNEVEIARELGVSRVPVREAFRLLESQGIAVRQANGRGLTLMPVDAKKIHEIVTVRASLEKLAVREALSISGGDRAVFEALRGPIAAMKQATRARDTYEHAQSDTDFHRVLVGLAGNEVLSQIWENLARKLTIIFGLSALQKSMGSIVKEHEQLHQVLLGGTLRDIDRELDEHLVETVEALDHTAYVANHRRPPA
jgi:DNA-binding GntR family transcriptional regulator